MAETPTVEALFGPPTIPTWVLGDYEILAELGRGGMGIVYLARQLSLGRLVALKMLPADLAGDELALARFRREMRLLARCDHPNIVKVLASGTIPDGQLYYAMEYVPGSDLEQVLARAGAAQTRIGDTSTLGSTTWARAVLSASRKMRRRRSVARRPTPTESTTAGPPPPLPLPPLPDLPSAPDDPGGYARRVAALGARRGAGASGGARPAGGASRHQAGEPDADARRSRVVLMDFGLAKGQGMELSASRAGGLLGTLRYAAPEQLAAASLRSRPRGRCARAGGDALGTADPPPAVRRSRRRAATGHDGSRRGRAPAAYD